MSDHRTIGQINSPCYQCKDRHVDENGTCHKTCEKFAAYQQKIKERNEARRLANYGGLKHRPVMEKMKASQLKRNKPGG